MANKLIDETSPYLQQHAHNPVDWYPWGEEALEKARSENKPILLSIGYSACHWCHVMESESFENEKIAAVMNELFISIKVDREERPDLDKIYQFSYQLLNKKSGGWPLNMFLSPDDQTPFFGGTYFPPSPRHRLPAFTEILQRVSEFYHTQPDDIGRQNKSIREYLLRSEQTVTLDKVNIDAIIFDEARQQLEKTYDEKYAGFGKAPKFPHPTNIERLLRHWSATNREDTCALDMACETLRAMASGGLYDQLGGGFFRYSVDDQWKIPHFEKMLYDNGPLLSLYVDAWLATGDVLFEQAAIETAEWVMRDMQSPEGGYYATLDADSDGGEGNFYVWTLAEIKPLLSEKEYAVVVRYYGLNGTPNFEGRWHLNLDQDLENIAADLQLDFGDARNLLLSARQKMLTAREMRVWPGRDEKILTSWNGLMIKGMAKAGHHLDREDFIESAERALSFIRKRMWQDGRLLATYKDDRARLNAYLDDYAFLADGVLALLEARWRDSELTFLVSILDTLLKHFSAKGGGFYFTADDHEKLIQRPRIWMDEAIPAGNGIAAQILLRVGYLLDYPHYIQAAEETIRAAWNDIGKFPHAHNALLTALEELLYPTETVILRGEEDELREWFQAFARQYSPRKMVFAIPANDDKLHQSLESYRVPISGVMAYVCKNGSCQEPIQRLDELF